MTGGWSAASTDVVLRLLGPTRRGVTSSPLRRWPDPLMLRLSWPSVTRTSLMTFVADAALPEVTVPKPLPSTAMSVRVEPIQSLWYVFRA